MRPRSRRRSRCATSSLTARRRLHAARAARGRRTAIAEHLLATEPVRRAATVAAYVSVGTEPGTGPLLEALLGAGRRVILPVLLPDDDLDWARAHRRRSRRAGRGLLEPAGPTARPGGGRHRRRRADPRAGRRPDAACGWAGAAAPTTGRSAGCRSAPSPARCSTTASCVDEVPARAARPAGRRAAVTPRRRHRWFRPARG